MLNIYMENKNQDQNSNSFNDFGNDLEIKSDFLDEGKELDLDAGGLPVGGEKRRGGRKARKEKNQEEIIVGKTKVILIKKLLENIKENNDKLIEILSVFAPGEEEALIGISQIGEEAGDSEITPQSGEETGKVIEGVFDGENMIGPDGKEYSVPANYASKSKLVEGDQLKLIITANGSFVYKQIKPVERQRLVGILEQTPIGEYLASLDNRHWRLLTASVTYYHGELGDEVVILAPKNGQAVWAAVDNIVKKSNF